MTDCYKCKKFPCLKTNEIQKRSVELGIRITCNGCKDFKNEYD